MSNSRSENTPPKREIKHVAIIEVAAFQDIWEKIAAEVKHPILSIKLYEHTGGTTAYLTLAY